MSPQYPNPYEPPAFGAVPAILAAEAERAAFIRRTYAHLAGAIGLFVALEAAIFTLVPGDTLQALLSPLLGNRLGWLLVLGAFVLVGTLASHWAQAAGSPAQQYLGLGLYVVAEAIVFVPLLYIANLIAPAAIPAAGLLTLLMFGGLTTLVFITGADLSGWGKYLAAAGLGALGLVICATLLGFTLGVWFSAAMVVLASVYILYDTSNVLHAYRTDQHVAAALALFASVALLLWYVLRMMMSLRRD
jgi:FtsH-binding integral membrane protein